MSPLRKRYDVFFRSTMVAFKAIRCWLRAKLSDKAPKNWDEKRKEIDERIMRFVRSPNKEATIEEIDMDEATEINVDINNDEREDSKPSVTKELGRMDIRSRNNDINKVLEYNILKRHGDDDIQTWKSYPGIGKIIQMS